MDIVVDYHLNSFFIINAVLHFEKKSLQKIQKHESFFSLGSNVFKLLLQEYVWVVEYILKKIRYLQILLNKIEFIRIRFWLRPNVLLPVSALLCILMQYGSLSLF